MAIVTVAVDDAQGIDTNVRDRVAVPVSVVSTKLQSDIFLWVIVAVTTT
jgi:hypothetical protein